jgi:hypothetical protein
MYGRKARLSILFSNGQQPRAETYDERLRREGASQA